MKIECVKNKITTLLQKMERVAGKNQNLPVLSCFLFVVENGKLFVNSTNLDLGVCGELVVRVLKEGRVAIPASTLSSFLSQLSDEGNVVFEAVEGGVNVSTKHTKTLIKTLPSDDFPSLPKAEGVPISLPAVDLIKGLRSVWYSSAASSMKPELSSVYVYYDQKNLIFCATDSFRLAEKKVSIKKIPDFHPVLIPFKNVVDIIHLFEGYKGDLDFVSNKGQLSLVGGELFVVSRIIEGAFPDYQQIIPQGFKTEVVLLKQDLVLALKGAVIFANSFNQVGFSVSTKEKFFEIETNNEHVGKNVVRCDAVVKGEGVVIDFNYRYLTDCFQSISADSLSLGFGGPHKPLVLRSVGDQSFTYLVMPMNK